MQYYCHCQAHSFNKTFYAITINVRDKRVTRCPPSGSSVDSLAPAAVAPRGLCTYYRALGLLRSLDGFLPFLLLHLEIKYIWPLLLQPDSAMCTIRDME